MFVLWNCNFGAGRMLVSRPPSVPNSPLLGEEKPFRQRKSAPGRISIDIHLPDIREAPQDRQLDIQLIFDAFAFGQATVPRKLICDDGPMYR